MSHLSDVAATLGAGEFAALTVAGYDSVFTDGGASTDNSMGFASKANYSWEFGGRVYFFGGPHFYNNLTNRSRIWYYDIATNTAESWDRPTAYPHARCDNVSCASSGNTLVLSTPFAASAGEQVYVKSGTNFIPDAFYTINTVVDSTHLVLSGNPTTGSAASGGTVYINGRFLHMVQWNTIDPARRQLLQPVIGNGVYALDLDLPDPSDVLRSEFVLINSDTTHIGSALAGSFELFPERNEYTYSRATDKVEHFDRTTLDWTSTDTVDLTGAQLGLGSVYSNVHKCMIFYGGYADVISNFKVQRLNLDGSYTQLDDAPEFFHAAHDTLAAEDPVSGDIVFFNEPTLGVIHCFTLNPSTGNWTTRNDIAANYPLGAGYGGTSIYGTVICPLPDKGLLFIFGNENIYIYKHTANTWATGGCPKGGLPGNFSFVGFESFDDDFKNAQWDAADTALNAEMVSRGHVQEPHTSTTMNNVVARINLDGDLLIPTRDTSVYYAAGGGTSSLRLDNISRCSQDQTSWWKGTIARDVVSPYRYVSPKSPDGNILYSQFRMRVDAGMGNTIYKQIWDWYQSSLTCTGGGSTSIHATGNIFYPEYAGLTIFFYGFNNWIQGFYTIINYISSTEVTLDRTPTNGGAGSVGYAYVSPPDYVDLWRGTMSATGDILTAPADHPFGDNIPFNTYVYMGLDYPNVPPWINGEFRVAEFIDNRHLRLNFSPVSGGGSATNGWMSIPATASYKVMIQFGNLYTSTSSSVMEVTTTEQRSTGYLGCSGQQGNDGYGLNTTVALVPGTWHEITQRVEILGAPNAGESRYTMWIDGQQVMNDDAIHVYWQPTPDTLPGDGIGEYYLTIFTTRRDPSQVHADGSIWYDDLVFSSQPIPFGASSAPVEPPPTEIMHVPAFLPWLFRS